MDTIIEIIKSIILGIVEGLTEFLPVSSTGHLIIFQNFVNFTGFSEGFIEMYTYVIQLGAILAVLVLYREKIMETIFTLFPSGSRPFRDTGMRFWLVIAFACIPGAVAEFTIGDFVERYLFNPVSVAVVLILGGFFMIWAERKLKPRRNLAKTPDVRKVTPGQALLVGCFQCLAVIPGMSRSASTIIGGWFAGMPNVLAAEFSFFLAIPVMVGMSGLKIIKFGGLASLAMLEILVLLVGFVVSFLVAIVVIKKFLGYLKRHSMRPFALYRIVFGGIILVLALANIITF